MNREKEVNKLSKKKNALAGRMEKCDTDLASLREQKNEKMKKIASIQERLKQVQSSIKIEQDKLIESDRLDEYSAKLLEQICDTTVGHTLPCFTLGRACDGTSRATDQPLPTHC